MQNGRKSSELIASPALIEALKSGKYAASEAEELRPAKAIEHERPGKSASRLPSRISTRRLNRQPSGPRRTNPRTAKIVAAPAETRVRFSDPFGNRGGSKGRKPSEDRSS